LPIDDRADCPPIECLADEFVPIEPVAAQGDEEIARLQRPAVGHDVANLATWIARSDPAAHGRSHPAEAQPESVTQPAT
jgi:hypothetical protein